MLKGVFVIAFLMSVGKWLLPWVFREVARTRTDELFVLTTILIALLAGGLTYYFGLSMALGAFLAGMMLGESQYKYQLEADIRPFRDILMGLFFVTVGMQLELTVLWNSLFEIVFGVFALMIVKVILVRAASLLVKTDAIDGWSAGVKLCQIGEFSFILGATAFFIGLISENTYQLVISTISVTLVISPFWIFLARKIIVSEKML